MTRNDYKHSKPLRMLRDIERVPEFLKDARSSGYGNTKNYIGTTQGIHVKISFPKNKPPTIRARSQEDLDQAHNLILDYLIHNPPEDLYEG